MDIDSGFQLSKPWDHIIPAIKADELETVTATLVKAKGGRPSRPQKAHGPGQWNGANHGI